MSEAHEQVQKDEALRRLRSGGYGIEADELERWRDANGNNWGWDGWIRKAHPHVVGTVWPDPS
jgi:hypothetical protein